MCVCVCTKVFFTCVFVCTTTFPYICVPAEGQYCGWWWCCGGGGDVEVLWSVGWGEGGGGGEGGAMSRYVCVCWWVFMCWWVGVGGCLCMCVCVCACTNVFMYVCLCVCHHATFLYTYVSLISFMHAYPFVLVCDCMYADPDAETRPCWCSHGGDGIDVGGICWRLHCARHRRLCYATVRNGVYCLSLYSCNNDDIKIKMKGAIWDVFTISSLRRKLSPTHMLSGLECNLVQIMCNTHQMQQVVCHLIRRGSSAINFDKSSNHFYFSFVLLAETINRWRRVGKEKTPDNKLQKMAHAKADMLTITLHIAPMWQLWYPSGKASVWRMEDIETGTHSHG